MTEDIIRIIFELSIEDIYDSNSNTCHKRLQYIIQYNRLTQNNLNVQRTIN